MSQLALELFPPSKYRIIDENGRHGIYGYPSDYGPAENITFQEKRVQQWLKKDSCYSSIIWAWTAPESKIRAEIRKHETGLAADIKIHNEVRATGLKNWTPEGWRTTEEDHQLSYLTALSLTQAHVIYRLDNIETLTRILKGRFPSLLEAT